MRSRDIARLGIPRGPCLKEATRAFARSVKAGEEPAEVAAAIQALSLDPGAYLLHPHLGALARRIQENLPAKERSPGRFVERKETAPWRQYGACIEESALRQMAQACALPIAVSGALMPDAHQGYGLPIGGVLATRDAVVPFAVGVDIACRMRLSVLDAPVAAPAERPDWLIGALEAETRFGVGATFKRKHSHAVMDGDWSVSPPTKASKDKAWAQLGTSGSGNHFVEFGTLTLEEPELGLAKGAYLALLSHSGSRGTGYEVARHYSLLARAEHRELPRELAHLAWLDLDRDSGQEYWWAMELMGRYAAANHELIHQHVARHLGVGVLATVENHHNFAWRERHGDLEVVVHRKGATPAGRDVLGVIPGSMGTPGYVVRGRGAPESLCSASHGAGRRMSRKQARERFNWADAERFLKARGVRLLSAGLDEVPMAYKDIDEVMAAQQDLVRPIARFDPRLVKMAPAGEKPED